MVSTSAALLFAIYTTKNTIYDADYIINWIDLIVINQCVKIPGHSHSIINKPFFIFYFQWLIFVLNGNAMKNTMLRKSFKLLERIAV